MTLTPRTELDAVNHILENMGEAPVAGLSGDLPLDALKARNKLRMVKEEVLSRGWFWNIEVHKLDPNPDGRIPAPAGALSVKPLDRLGFSLSIRNGFLYRTQAFNNGPLFEYSVLTELVMDLAFADLPPTAKFYVTRKAAREFQVTELGTDSLTRQDTEEEARAWAELVGEDLRARPATIRDNPDLQSILGPNRRNWRL